MDTFLSQIFLSHWLILMGTFLCVGFFFFFVIFVNICICASAIYTMGEKRVENVCMYIFLQINLCRQKSCFDHAQHADKSSQNDWRENSKQIFQIHTALLLRSARQLNIRRSRKNLWSLVERAYVDMVRRLCVSLSVTLHEINLVKIRSAIKWDWHELITFHYSKAFSKFSKNILQNIN